MPGAPRSAALPETKAGHRHGHRYPARSAAADRPPQSAGGRPASSFSNDLHRDPGEVADVTLVQLPRLRVELLAIQHREARALDVSDEIPLRRPRDHRDLHARLAERRKILGQFDLLAGIGPGEELQG